MSSIAQLLEQAQASLTTNPKDAERIYKEILSTASGEGNSNLQEDF
jgi:hypothetical protein